jgi:hypothetical protein
MTSISSADGYYIQVVTVTTENPSAQTENTTLGAQQSFTTPGAPDVIELTDMSEKLLVGWSPPSFDGGHPVLGYQVFVNGEVACALESLGGQDVCASSDDRVFTLNEALQSEAYEFEVAAVNTLGIGAMATVGRAIVPVNSASGGLPSLNEPETSGPGKPGKPSSGSKAPTVLDSDSWIPATPDSPIAEEPKAPSDGTDTSASGTDTDEANFTWLMLIIALLMSFGLLRVVIRGRKLRS